MAQADELKGMVQIHYGILNDIRAELNKWDAKKKAYTIGTKADMTKLVHWALYKGIYDPDAKKATAARSKAWLNQMIDSDDFPCAKLNKPVNKGIRANWQKGLGIDNTLFCSVLKYGVLLPKGEREVTRGWIW